MDKIAEKYKEIKKIFKKKKLKEIFLMIVKSNTSPNQIALAAAIGILFSVIPTFSIGMFTALFIAWKKNLNLLAAYLGSVVVTPLNSSIVYFINFKVGNFFSQSTQTVSLPIEAHDIKYIIKEVYFGGVINGVILSLLIYFLLYLIVLNYRRMK